MTDDPACWYHPATFAEAGDGHGGTASRNRAVARCREICAGCPVRLACFEQVMADEANAPFGGRWGVYAALTAKERHAIEKAQKEAAA